MENPYHPEQQPVEKPGSVQPAEVDKLDAKIAHSKPAADSPASVSPTTDAAELQKQLPEQNSSPAVEADAKIAQAGREGTTLETIGTPENDKQFTHLQGDNARGFQGTCGLVSCEGVLGKAGVKVSENDIVDHAVKNGECNISDDPAKSGGTTAADQAQILGDYGVPAHVESGGTVDKLASQVQEGRGVILEANAGELWNDANYYGDGSANHAITVTGMEHDTATGKITGFYVNDSGTGQAGRFLDVDTLKKAWVDAGGVSVVTNATHISRV
jgi:hypothetical protein